MPDNYQFKEAFSTAKKIREAVETGTDSDGNSILRNVVAVEPGQSAIPTEQQSPVAVEDTNGQKIDPAKTGDVQSLEAYRSEPDSYDPSVSTKTPQCDAFMIPDGSNSVRSIELKATSGGTLQTITVPTNAVIPMAVEETGTSGNATTFLALNL